MTICECKENSHIVAKARKAFSDAVYMKRKVSLHLNQKKVVAGNSAHFMT